MKEVLKAAKPASCEKRALVQADDTAPVKLDNDLTPYFQILWEHFDKEGASLELYEALQAIQESKTP